MITILPLGAHEQHGPHLPPETDTVIAEALAARAVARLRQGVEARLLPVEPTGYSPEHMDFAGSRSLGYGEAVTRWIGIAESAYAQGSRRFVLFNAHGGNSPLMTIVTTELRRRHAMLAVATSWTRFGYPDGLVAPRERALGIHGGLVETSVMLALRPDMVDMSQARDFPSRQAGFLRDFRHLRAYGPHAFGWLMQDLAAEGVTGNAAAATAELGESLIEHAVNGFVELLEDVARFDLALLGPPPARPR